MSNFKLRICMLFVGLVAILLLVGLKAFAQGSGYYGLEDNGRPPSAFSLCCCKKIHQDSQQALYTCNYVDFESCPDETKQYQVATFGCPSNLMFTKYTKAEAE